MDVATKLSKLRAIKRMSQEELADKIGVSTSTIGNWENGTSIKNIHIPKLAEVLEVPHEYFYDDKHIVINQTNNDNATNNVAGFEITIKMPKSFLKT